MRHGRSIDYADTGAGVVRRLRPDTGRRQVLIGPWHPGRPSNRKHGTGISDWSDAAHGPPDGDEPTAIDDWIATAGDQRLIATPGVCWIKPQESLGEYSNVVGARAQTSITGSIKRPAGLAADDDRLYVADNPTGRIHTFAWEGMRPGPVLETGSEALGGLAIDPSDKGWVYFTDSVDDSVGRVALE